MTVFCDPILSPQGAVMVACSQHIEVHCNCSRMGVPEVSVWLVGLRILAIAVRVCARVQEVHRVVGGDWRLALPPVCDLLCFLHSSLEILQSCTPLCSVTGCDPTISNLESRKKKP